MAVVAPSTVFPLSSYERLCFLKNVVKHPQITVGDYTYYDDFENVENFQKNVRYLFDFTGDRLTIGKFCMIASGVEFLMNGANHLTDAVSAYPFAIFGGEWGAAMEGKSYPTKGDTTVGNDVWIGYRATIMPGVTIGNGAIIGAYAVVTRDVAPYTIVGGNPAKHIRQRFDDTTTAQLLAVAWWDWPIEKITQYASLLTGDTTSFLAQLTREPAKEGVERDGPTK
jgi:virginiamycin A acetyltransferase